MGNKSKFKQQRRIVKDSNPNKVTGTLSIMFEIMRDPLKEDGIFSVHVQDSSVNAFIHNHDAANKWLAEHSAEAFFIVMRQAFANAKASIIQQHKDASGQVVEQKIVTLEQAQLEEAGQQKPEPQFDPANRCPSLSVDRKLQCVLVRGHAENYIPGSVPELDVNKRCMVIGERSLGEAKCRRCSQVIPLGADRAEYDLCFSCGSIG